MPGLRRSLTIPLVARDSNSATDARLTNCYTEKTPIGNMVVKRAGLAIDKSIGIGCAQGAATFNGDALFIKSDTIYSSFQHQASGSSWTAATSPPKPTNGSAVGTAKGGMLASIGGVLYSIGGRDNLDTTVSVYKSTDSGTTWSTIATPWTTTNFPSHQRAVVFNARIFVIDPQNANKAIWSSADGISWVQNTTDLSGGDGTRTALSLIVHGGLLYAFLGNTGTTISIWRSSDGTTWSSVATIAGTGQRTEFMVYSLGGNLYIAGGIDGTTTLKNDVWRSVDSGVTWTQITASAAFSARKAAAFWVYDSKLWIAGGSTSTGGYVTVLNDVHSSSDGVTWSLVTAAAGWIARAAPSCCIHGDTMFIGPGLKSTGAISSLHFAVLGSATATALPSPTQNCLPIQIALIPANGAIVAKAFIKSTRDAWVWDGSTITKVTDADYPAITVHGVAYLDGTVYVMDSKGVIYGSDLLTPLSWNALNFITANAEADSGIAIARQLDNIIAFKDSSIEFFYDAANPAGSPLSRQSNALLEVGCAAARSIAYSDNTLFFMSKHKQHGRSVMKFTGIAPAQVSTPWIDRILDIDNLVDIYAFVIRMSGHVFYFLTLTNSNITLVYDDTMNEWHQATSMTAFPAAMVSAMTVQPNGTILVTMPLPHGASDGDPVTISGAVPSSANGLFNLRYDTAIHSVLQFSYLPVSPIIGSITGTVTAVFYSIGHFRATHYADAIHSDLVLDESNGSIYRINPGNFNDAGAPIDVHVRTEREDMGTIDPKSYESLKVVADNTAGNLAVRYTPDDYSTFSKYRLVDLTKRRPMLKQLGSSERRAWEFRHTSNAALRVQAVEISVEGWGR